MRFTDNLDVVKFVCKEVWMFLFKKQVDNLKTNHRVRVIVVKLRKQTTQIQSIRNSGSNGR